MYTLEDILLFLGYPSGIPEFAYNPSPKLATQVDQTLTNLVAIDTALAQARLDSMAVEVGDLKVDYTRNITILKAEGSRLLHELSNLVSVPVQYDKYLRTAQGQPRRNSYSVQSYW